MDQTSADGPARMTWYDPIVAGGVAAAQSLDIPLTIGGDGVTTLEIRPSSA